MSKWGERRTMYGVRLSWGRIALRLAIQFSSDKAVRMDSYPTQRSTAGASQHATQVGAQESIWTSCEMMAVGDEQEMYVNLSIYLRASRRGTLRE